MNENVEKLKDWARNHKTQLIIAGATILGAAVGAAALTVVVKRMNEAQYIEGDVLEEELEDLEDAEETE